MDLKMSTPAIQYLKQKKITFDVLKYDHAEKGAEFAARATGYPLAQTVKTLVVDLEEKGHTLVLMTGDKQLSMKRLARACGVKRATMADTNTAERLTGYLIGGISPFGTRQKLPIIMDESIFGVMDMNGSLHEHTSDRPVRGRPLTSYRGGSIERLDDAVYFHLASRNSLNPTGHYPTFGVRLVAELE